MQQAETILQQRIREERKAEHLKLRQEERQDPVFLRTSNKTHR